MLIAAANDAPFTAETHARINALNEAYRELIQADTTPAAVVAPPRRVEQRLFGKPRIVLERATHYQALHVASIAENRVLDVAHRVVSNAYPPASPERARVDDAYRVLHDPESRARYDRSLGIKHESEAPAPEDAVTAGRGAPLGKEEARRAAPRHRHPALPPAARTL